MRRLRALLAGERGFTLTELLVALIAGMIVVTGTMAILISAVDLSASNADRVNANQEGRLAMTRITQALDSSCVAASTPPVLAGSSANEVDFYSSSADAANIEPTEVKLAWGGTGGSALTMKSYAWASGSSASSWTFASTPTSVTLLAHMSTATIGGSSQPVFQYYGYTPGTGVLSTTPYATPLSAANALTTSEVTVSYLALPDNGWTSPGRGATYSDSVVLRLTPASGNATASNTPCT